MSETPLGGDLALNLVAGLMGQEHEDIRKLAASSVAMLARPGDGSFLPRLYPLLHDASVLVRMSAVEAIRAIADPVSVEPLLAPLPNEPRAVQREILRRRRIGASERLHKTAAEFGMTPSSRVQLAVPGAGPEGDLLHELMLEGRPPSFGLSA